MRYGRKRIIKAIIPVGMLLVIAFLLISSSVILRFKDSAAVDPGDGLFVIFCAGG